MSAGIRVWMLTGDKRETAINIAQSSALASPITRLLILDKPTYAETLTKLENFVETVISEHFLEGAHQKILKISQHTCIGVIIILER